MDPPMSGSSCCTGWEPEGTTVSATSLNAPKDAKKAFEKGTTR
jgi:hypothetical protein